MESTDSIRRLFLGGGVIWDLGSGLGARVDPWIAIHGLCFLGAAVDFFCLWRLRRRGRVEKSSGMLGFVSVLLFGLRNIFFGLCLIYSIKGIYLFYAAVGDNFGFFCGSGRVSAGTI